ncbi:TIGR02117 family protein [Chitinibacter sp. GC72]|uniref:TIGR02117 family protein n=1 Tax=Chitinibacter sp. GC72 TaxID=1526917 RepID=UPI0012F7F3DE|nr:TIGR02117 family protein [Chitinibacter sp. GC72]
MLTQFKRDLPQHIRQIGQLIAALALYTLLCALTPLAHAETAPNQQTVYVVNNGWHTGLIVPAAPFKERFPALQKRFAAASHFEIGWGDKGFYQAKEITTKITFKAMFGLSGSIMHIVGLGNTPAKYIAKEHIKALCLSNTQLEQLNAAISESLALNAQQDVQPLGSGLYGDSEFFAAVGNYYLLNTCNSWTAQRLARAGLPIWSRFKFTAASVMNAIADLPAQCLPE